MDAIERPRLESRLKPVRTVIIKPDDRKPVGAQLSPCGIGKHQLGAAVGQHVADGVGGELVTERHRDQPGPHDAVIGAQIVGAVGCQDGDGVAALETPCQQ